MRLEDGQMGESRGCNGWEEVDDGKGIVRGLGDLGFWIGILRLSKQSSVGKVGFGLVLAMKVAIFEL